MVLPLIALTTPAAADLSAIGTIDPATGFPAYVQDANNVQLGPCNRVELVTADGETFNKFPCLGLELDDPRGAFVDGNIAEFTYYRAESNIVRASGERIRLRMEVQGGVIPPASINNAVRLVAREFTSSGTLTVTSPFGTESFPIVAGEKLDTEMAGGVLGQEPNFDPAKGGNIMCFWGNGTETMVDGEIYLGDGQTEAPLVPSPACPQQPSDLMLIVEFDSDAANGDFSDESALFTVEARRLPAAGVSAVRATYERNGSGDRTRVDVFATSIPGQSVVVSGRGFPDVMMVEDGMGNYFARRHVNRNLDGPPDVVSISGTTSDISVVDEVHITRCEYDANGGQLLVRAVSSDGATNPKLTAFDQNGFELGDLAGGSLTVIAIGGVPPSEVTVESEAGGSASTIVNVRGGNVTAL